MKIRTVSAPGCKLHLCGEERLAEAVARELEQRFGQTRTEDLEVSALHLDFGGSILTNFETCKLELPSRHTFTFWPHQTHLVERALDGRVREGGYVKLHGAYSCICLNPGDAAYVRTWVREHRDTLERITEQFFRAFDAGMEKIGTVRLV